MLSLRLGRVGGIDLRANWSVLVIAVLIAGILATSALPAASPHQPAGLYWVVGAVTTMLFLASLLAHELAHALVASRHGVKVRSITLWMLGGVTALEGDPPTPAADLLIALAGPVASLAAGGLFYVASTVIRAAGGPAVVVAAAIWLTVMNVILAVFNLLPGAPLDGGRVLRALLWRHYGNRERADRAAARSGQVLGAVISGLGIAELLILRSFGGLWLMLLGWFLISAAVAEAQAARALAALAGLRAADVMTPHPEIAPGWRSVAEFASQVAWSRQDAFPVVGFGGELSGVVLTSQLARIPATDRPGLRLDQVALAVPPEYRAAPDDPAGPLIRHRPIGGEVAAVVLADGEVTGIVLVSDLERVLRRRGLVTGGS